MDFREAVLIPEQDRKKTREPHKAPERHAVKQTEQNHVALPQDGKEFGEALPARRAGRVLGEQQEYNRHGRERNQRQAEDVVPAESLGQARTEKGGEQRAGQTEASQAHRQSLKLRRIPAAGHRQRDDETRARDAQQKSHDEQTCERVRPQPAHRHRQRRQAEHEQARAFGANGVRQPAEGQPQQSPAQQRHGGEQPFLRRRQFQFRRNVAAQPAEEQPAHRADAETQEGAEERWEVARFPKTGWGFVHSPALLQLRCQANKRTVS